MAIPFKIGLGVAASAAKALAKKAAAKMLAKSSVVVSKKNIGAIDVIKTALNKRRAGNK